MQKKTALLRANSAAMSRTSDRRYIVQFYYINRESTMTALFAPYTETMEQTPSPSDNFLNVLKASEILLTALNSSTPYQYMIKRGYLRQCAVSLGAAIESVQECINFWEELEEGDLESFLDE